MPKKYIGLDVLEYEKGLLYSEIIDYEIRIDSLQDMDWYTEEEKKAHIEIYNRYLDRQRAKMKIITDTISKYSDGFNTECSYSSYEPLQEYYQEEIERLLAKFKKEVRSYYLSMYNLLMSAGSISVGIFAKSGAKQLSIFQGTKDIVSEYLYKEQIREINNLANPKKTQITAIQNKYDFFRSALVDCHSLVQEARKL